MSYFPRPDQVQEWIEKEKVTIAELESSLIEASQELDSFDQAVADSPELRRAYMDHLSGYNSDKPFQLPEETRVQRLLIVRATDRVKGLLEASQKKVQEWENTLPIVTKGYELADKLEVLIPAYQQSFESTIAAWEAIQNLANEYGISATSPQLPQGIALSLSTYRLGESGGGFNAEISPISEAIDSWFTVQNN